MCSKMVEFERYRAISLLYAMERGWEGEEKGKRGGVKGGGEREGDGRGGGAEGKGRGGEGKGMGPSYVGMTAENIGMCSNHCKFANMLGNNSQTEQYADNYLEICLLILTVLFMVDTSWSDKLGKGSLLYAM